MTKSIIPDAINSINPSAFNCDILQNKTPIDAMALKITAGRIFLWSF